MLRQQSILIFSGMTTYKHRITDLKLEGTLKLIKSTLSFYNKETGSERLIGTSSYVWGKVGAQDLMTKSLSLYH